MFALRANRDLRRSFLSVVCLALLAGCIPQPVDPPASPANLAATSGNATVTLTWTASSGATGYQVTRATVSGGPYAAIGGSASPGYTDSSVTNDTIYYYIVAAVNKGGASISSSSVSAYPTASPPAAPTNLTAAAGNNQVSLTWSVSNSASSYVVKRTTTRGETLTQIATPTANSYTDTSLVNGTTYYYAVSAVNWVGEGANSATISAAPSPPPPTTFGTWTNVTPSSVDLTACGNPGSPSIQVDPAHRSNLYALFSCLGIWKSVDYGATWSGPINTGTNGLLARDCEGAIAISPGSTAATPTVYQECIRGSTGFWRSTDGGVNWTRITINATTRQDYVSPAVDPYDPNHLLMTGHEFDSLIESFDGGLTWTSVSLDSRMLINSGTGFGNSFVFFIDSGSALATGRTWLWMAGGGSGGFGTWRTANSGASWTQVDTNEVSGGSTQIYQPDYNGVLFMAGSGSGLGQGVLRSSDYGQTWAHVGLSNIATVVTGTPGKNVYSMCSCSSTSFAVASDPGTGTWVSPGTPSALTHGAAQIVIVNDGTHNVLVGAMESAGLWRYVEP